MRSHGSGRLISTRDPTVPPDSSPLERLARISQRLGVDLRVKRDDLLPIPGGGSKFRKINAIADDARGAGATAVVTVGATQSNHARVTALIAAARGWQCHLVLHGDATALERPTGNLLLALLAGATAEVVAPAKIEDGVARASSRLRDAGEVPFVIPGGGHTLSGCIAMVRAVHEAAEQFRAEQWIPNHVVVASGTGTTQAGLIAGFTELGMSTRISGISVGRRNPRGADAVRQSLEDLRAVGQLTSLSAEVDFRDEWLGAGYGDVQPEVVAVIRDVARTEGLILDPTYSGRAFAAMLALIAAGEIRRGSNVLFWHTGGLLNLLAADSSLFRTRS